MGVPVAAAGTPPQRPQRVDAARNRQRVLDAAVELFAERGVEAPVPDIARRAGVGVATVYRNFPSKQALLSALMERRVLGLEQRVRAALAADADPWEAFTDLLREAARAQAGDSAFRQYMTTVTLCPPVTAARERLLDACGELMRRAQAAGQLRPDVAAEDVPVLLIGLSWSLCGPHSRDETLWERYLAIMVDGLRAEGARPLPHPPADRETLGQVLVAVQPPAP
jgi:AcrR family transcriptional regulator